MPEIKVTIRPYEDGDAQSILNLITNIEQNEFNITTSQDGQLPLANIKDYYSNGSSGIWVAEAGNTVVGTISLLDITNNAAALQKMFVAIGCRGTISGVAKKLLSQLFYEAQTRGVKDIFLGTSSALPAANRFFEKHDFIRYSKTDLPSRFPIMSKDSRFYHRSV
jgi:N-acetylglutamate synthase-like GNAT family acetyltransferase